MSSVDPLLPCDGTMSADEKTSSVKDKRALAGMTPEQEVCNAATMFSPSVVAFLLWMFPPTVYFWDWRSGLVTLAIVLHLPFSVYYHAALARRALDDAIDNSPRRLDQTFVHVASILISWAVSSSPSYATFCSMINIYFISRLWVENEAGKLERMLNVGLGTLFYGLGGLFRGDYYNFVCGLSYFLGGAAVMFAHLGGWGHSIMHLCLGGLMYHVMISAGEWNS
eukprot:TRINITY_DN93568_c0_g1_i1.p1 TRINITY_DN93568_c0_g1~~TRINITY_DN93568_c0_g1_i1.p1  ORF type:complete len:231 (+),score=16.99 TRINITY_DN93568_c0_g1_i1:23-694(+)